MSEQKPRTTPQDPQVEGPIVVVRTELPDVEGHAIKIRFEPVPGPEVESHGAARTIDIESFTLERVDGGPLKLIPARPDDVEGHGFRIRAPEPGPEVESHAIKIRFEPVPDVEGHGFRMRAPSEVEAHALERPIEVTRLTVTPAGDGEPIVLEPLGADAEGEATYRVLSGLPEVSGHAVARWSDERLKQAIAPITEPLRALGGLEG